MSPAYFWCLTPVGPYGRLIAWPAGACVHRFPHGFSLAHFGDSLSVAFFLRSTLLEGRVSSSDGWLCLVDREQEIDLNDDQGNKTKGCSVSAAASVAYRQTRVYFIRWVSEPTCWVPSSSLPDVRRLVSDKMKVASGILPMGDYCTPSLLSLDFNNSGPVGMVTLIDTCSDGRAGSGGLV